MPSRRSESRAHMMLPFSTLDLIALGWFVGAWIVYGIVVDRTAYGERGLTALMHGHREAWMRRMIERQNRIVDTQITGALQNGTAFFASTSVLWRRQFHSKARRAVSSQ